MTQSKGSVEIPAGAIGRDPLAWPRRGLDHQRVADFIDLYAEGGTAALPPLEVVVDPERNFLLYDGHHRLEALLHFGDSELKVPVFVIEVAGGQDPVEVAFERAVAMSATSAKPLTRTERRAAAVRLLRVDDSRSDREIARIAGMSPTTVGKLRRELDSTTHREEDPELDAGEWYAATTTARELAARLFRGLEKVRETKGIGLGDFLLGDRTTERFARVLTDAYGEAALERATEYRSWIDGAIKHLKEASPA